MTRSLDASYLAAGQARHPAHRRADPASCGSRASSERFPVGFTGISPAHHQIDTLWREGPSAMKENKNENIVIPIRIERMKIWTCWTLEATTWLICLGLLAASAVVAVCAALAWLVSGSEVVLTLGVGGGLLLGLAGVWHLLRQLDRAVKQLRPETPGGE